LQLIDQRIAVLEKTYVGVTTSLSTGPRKFREDEETILDRLHDAARTVNEIEKKVPAFKSCYEMILQMRPIILERKQNAVQIMQKVNELVANKELINQQTQQLLIIGELGHLVNDDNYGGNRVINSYGQSLS